MSSLLTEVLKRKFEELDPIEIEYIDRLNETDPKLAEKAAIALTTEPIIVVNGDPQMRVMLTELYLLGKSNPLNDIKEYHGYVSGEPSNTVEAMKKAIQEHKNIDNAEEPVIVMDSISEDGVQINQLTAMAIKHMGLDRNLRSYSSLPLMRNEGTPFKPPKRNRSKKRRR